MSLFLSDLTAAADYPLARQGLGLDEMELGAVSADLDLYPEPNNAGRPGTPSTVGASWLNRSSGSQPPEPRGPGPGADLGSEALTRTCVELQKHKTRTRLVDLAGSSTIS